ncbi:MAG: hypothetical protein ABSH35_02370 [Isosphaeraceae bacterium]|jgi:hypothetical protein
MGVIGDPSGWEDTFPDRLIPDIIDMVIGAWEHFDKPSHDEQEVSITRRFKILLVQDKKLRRLPVLIDREIWEDDPVTAEQIGRIDIRLVHGYREDVYFAFECKRLNVTYKGRLYTQAGDYVTDGMARFVDEQYATGLPTGGMIGYVVDGLCDNAIRAVARAMSRHRELLHLEPAATLKCSNLRPKDKLVKESEHSPPGRPICLYHVFVSCIPAQTSQSN